jgi:2-phosphosulfolactate phosphatase
VTREDQLAAGAIADALLSRGDRETDDATRHVVGEWRELLGVARSGGRSISEQLAIDLRATQGGRNLVEIGMEEDLPRCADLDRLDVAPHYDPASGRITAP